VSKPNFFERLAHILRPARTIPKTPWTSANQWDLGVTRLLLLLLGLSCFGFGEAFLFKANLGNSPWAVFAQGIAHETGFSIGWASFLISGVVLLLWIPLGNKPGFGTLMNMVFIAITLQLGIDHLPAIHGAPIKIATILFGIALVGIGSGFYITCGLGPGPRDGLMTGIHKKTGIRVSRARLFIEILVFLLGWALGGTVGLGTALFALLIGNSVALGFKFVSIFPNQQA
jgi:uncharacterized membrane protein YczE